MKNKIISIILLALILVNALQGIVQAIELNGQNVYIENLGDCEMHLQYWKESDQIWSYILTYMAGYRIDGKLHYAYCMQHERKGIGSDLAEDGYEVNIKEMLSNEKVWRAVINGFPYRSAEDLGVKNDQDAFVATKQAIYSVMYDWDVNARYRGADERGWQIVNAINKIVNNARYGTETPSNSNVIKIDKVGEMKQTKDGYYTQEFSVSSSIEMDHYIFLGFENFPRGSFVTGMDNKVRTTFSKDANFKVWIPIKNITNDYNGKIKIKGNVKSYPVFYGESYDEKLQDYALTYDAFNEVGSEASLFIDGHKSRLKIIKTDAETGKPIANVEFNVKYADGTNIGTYKTNKDGIINVTGLKQGKIVVTETKTLSQYILDETEKELVIGYDDIANLEVENYHKKGNIKLIKVDKDNNNVKLEGIEFDLINSNNKVIAHLVTDSKGEAEVKNIDTGNYTLRETATKKEYKIALDKDITVEWNKTFQIKVENEKKKGRIKVVKVDKDNKEIKLEGVEFQVINSENKIVETIKTNKNGEAVTSNLPIGEYKVKEISLGTNQEYVLSEEPKTITIEEDKIKTITFENERKKGNLKIYKVDLDNEKVPVPDVEFEIIDKEGYKYTAKTDKDGIANIENLRTGIAQIKEIKTNKIYKLDGKTYSAEIKWNEIAEIIIKNEKIKGQVKVIKVSEENKEIKLEGVEFQIINSENKIVETIKTNKNGEAVTSKLPVGEYKVKEISLGTNQEYVLTKEPKTITIEEDKINTVTFENERKKGNLKIYKVDLDNEKVPIQNVEFEITDKDGYKYTTKTDENGIAYIENLRTGIVKIKETKTNNTYNLNKETYYAEIKWKETSEITITNEKIKGQVKIMKISADYNSYTNTEAGTPIENVKFEIYDDDGNLTDTIITSADGIAVSKELAKGKYVIKEIETGEFYEINEEEFSIEIIENGEVIDLKITNKSKTPPPVQETPKKLPVTGF